MRLKLDENLPVSAVPLLAQNGHDVDTVADEGLTGAEDGAVLQAATADDRLLITLDRGLGDVRAYPPGTHGGVLVLRLDQQAPRAVHEVLTEILGAVDLLRLSGAVAVWRSGSLRVRLAP
ncbi:MAG: DUF5615 family PIN-like protein [Kineosporiaceae bacterium]